MMISKLPRLPVQLPTGRVIRLILASFFLLNIVFILFFFNNNLQSAYGIPVALGNSSAALSDLGDLISSTFNGAKKQEYQIPNLPYEELSFPDKVYFKLNQVSEQKDKYWLADTTINPESSDLIVTVQEFIEVPLHPHDDPDSNLVENWSTKNTLYYDPRFTLSIYLNEIREMFLDVNPDNVKDEFKDKTMTVPFNWADWVDMTLLNEELSKPEDQRINCDALKKHHRPQTKIENYCYDNKDVTEEMLISWGMNNTNQLPGFTVVKSPRTLANNKVRMLEGKSRLLTNENVPLSIIFLAEEGSYEVQVDRKQSILQSGMLHNYLESKNIALDDLPETGEIVMNPRKEYRDLVSQVPARPLSALDDKYNMSAIVSSEDQTISRSLTLVPDSFDYQQNKVDAQVAAYEERLNKLEDMINNELTYDAAEISKLSLTRKERLHYNGLKISNSRRQEDEDVYFQLARLVRDEKHTPRDDGWHYDWRFFNGALRYAKAGFTQEEMEIREKVILHRLVRNWFKFANEKGLISWIAHGPLLSWYWDGLLFPFDEDIDIQMPAGEINRLALEYNQTLIVEDINEGYGRFMIDCGTYLHHRGKSYKENHIDARFIDIDTGSYIDITGLGISNEKIPERYDKVVKEAEKEGHKPELYNCRNLHYYSFKELSPLRYTMLEGVPLYVPNQVIDMLNVEYKVGTTSMVYENYFYVEQLRLWVPQEKFLNVFDEKKYITENKIDKEKMLKLVTGITEKQLLALLDDKQTLQEFYLTNKLTKYHDEEMEFIEKHSAKELQKNQDYNLLTSQFKMQSPIRKALFEYESLERLQHKDEKA